MSPNTPVKVTVLKSPATKPDARIAWPVPTNPARCTRSTRHDKFSICGLNREEVAHLIVALDRTPMLRYVALDLVRLAYPLDDEVNS